MRTSSRATPLLAVIETLEPRVLLSGTPDIQVRYNAAVISSGDETPGAEQGTTFGALNVQGGTFTREFIIDNRGSAVLHLSAPQLSNSDYRLTAMPALEVQPGYITTFTVCFDPSIAGADGASVQIASDDPDTPSYWFLLSGEGITYSEITVRSGWGGLTSGEPAAANKGTLFGSIDIKQTQTRRFTIRNEGARNLVFSDTAYEFTGAGAAQFQLLGFSANLIAPGATASFDVAFDPTVAGTHEAALTFHTNDHDTPSFAINLAGTATSYVNLDVIGQDGDSILANGDSTPAVFDGTLIGEAEVGHSSFSLFRLRNNGSGTLHFGDITIGGADASQFHIHAQPDPSLASDDSVLLQVDFAPTSYGVKQAVVSIASDDPDANPYTFSVSGTGLAPEVRIDGLNAEIASGDTVPSAADGTDFGSAMLAASVYRSFSIRNVGTSVLELTLPSVLIGGDNPGDFSIDSNVVGNQIEPGSSEQFVLKFTPSAAGLRTAVITVRNDDSDEGTYTFKVQGTGVAAGSPEIAVVHGGATIADGDTTPSAEDGTDFGVVDLRDGVVSRSFTVLNLGVGPLTNVLATLSGGYTTDWSITQQLPGTIEAGASAVVTVTWNPSIQQQFFPVLSIRSNDGDENPYDITLTGTVSVYQDIEIKGKGVVIVSGDDSPSADDGTDWGNIACGSTANTRTFYIYSRGTTPLQLTAPVVTLSGPGAGDWVLTQPTLTSVSTSTTFSLNFRPGQTGLRQATVQVHSQDPDEGVYSFDIQGTGTGSVDIEVRGASFIADGDATPSTTEGSEFGSADLGAPVTKTFTIKNTGYQPLVLSDLPPVVISGDHASDFVVTLQPASGPLLKDQTTTFQVTFTPSGDGVRTAAISIASNDPDENPYNFAIRGSGVTHPGMTVKGNDVVISDGDTSASLADYTNFGSADVRDGSVTRTFYIYNSGPDTLTLTGATPVTVSGGAAADFQIVTQPVASVPPGQYTTFHVRFNPANDGARSTTLNIASNDTARNPYNFTIAGTGTLAAEIDVKGNGVSIASGDASPSADDFTDFGSLVIGGGTVSRTFTIANSGSGPLNLADTPKVRITGDNAAEFAVTVQPGGVIAANGGSSTFTVVFTPAVGGTRHAAVSIDTNDADEDPYTFAIQATALALPEAEIRGNNVIIVDGDATASAADHTDFGSTDWIGGAVVRTFTLYNRGSQDLSLDGPKVQMGGPAGGDFLVTPPAVNSVPAGESTTFQITFDPTTTGVREATVTVYTNDSDEGQYDFAVRGTGSSVADMQVSGTELRVIADGDATPSSADGTDFGGADVVGGTITRTFSIDNLGSGALNLTGAPLVQISGVNAADFTVVELPQASLERGVFTSFAIRFDPGAGGLRNATVSIASNDPDENPYNFAICGTGLTDAEIDVRGNGVSIASGDDSPAEADLTSFGTILVGAGTLSRTFTIHSIGSASLLLTGTPKVQITGANAADFAVTTQPAGTVAANNGVTNFTVVFTPGEGGQRSAVISIANTDQDESTYTFAVSATASVAAEAEVRGNNVVIADGDASAALADHTDFGSAEWTGGSVVRTFTVYNRGSDTLQFTDARVTLGGEGAGDFAVLENAPEQIAPGGSGTFQISFDPSSIGAKNATVTVHTNDADEAAYDFAVRGTGSGAAEMQVEGNGQAIADGSAAAADTNHTGFGSTDLVGGSVARTFTIRNLGNAPLTLSGAPRVRISGLGAADFTVTSQPDGVIAMGESTTFAVRFDPQTAGVRTATVTIDNNDPNENPYDFVVSGTGMTSAEIDVRGNNLAIVDGDSTPSGTDHTEFGAILLGSGVITRTFTIANTGSGPLNLLNDPPVSVVGGDGAFSVTQQPASPIAAGESATFEVTFTPAAAGLRSATVVIASNDGNESTYDFTIAAVTTVPQVPEIAVTGGGQDIASGDDSPRELDGTAFGDASLGGDAVVHSFIVHSEGNATLTLTGTPRVLLSNLDDFAVVAPLGETIPAGGQSTLQIAFHPASLGAKTCLVTIASNDADEAAYTFTLQGNGSGIAPDGFENNDELFSALDLGLLAGLRSESALNIDSVGDEDWFSFTAGAGGAATFTASRSDVHVQLRDSGGGTLADSVQQEDGSQRLSYDLTLGVQYCLRITGELSAVNESYDLALDVPTLTAHAIVPLTGYSFTDQDGDLVTVKLTGGGTGNVYLQSDTAARSDMYRIVLNDTGFASALSVSVVKAGDGNGRTTVTDILVVDGSLKSLTAPTTNLRGDVLIDGSIGTLALGDATASYKLIQLCRNPAEPIDPLAKLNLTVGRVMDVSLDAGREPVANITALEWLEMDALPDTIKAASIDKINITGQAMNMTLGLLMLEGNFQADVEVGTPGRKTVAPLGELTVAGMIGPIHIRVQGVDALGQSIKKLNVKYAGSGSPATVNVDGGIAAITTSDWLNGVISAGWIGTLTTTPNTMGRAGRLGADIVLTGANLPLRKAALGTLTVQGPWLPSTLELRAGYAGTIKATGLADGVSLLVQGVDALGQSIASLQLAKTQATDVTVAGGIGTLSTNDWQDGLIKAGWIGTLSSTANLTNGGPGDFGGSLLLSGERRAATKATLGTVTIARDLLAETDWEIKAGFVGAVSVARAANNFDLRVQGWDALGQSIVSLQAGKAENLAVTADAGIGSLKFSQLAGGAVHAGWIGTLTTTANAALGTHGDITTDMELTGARLMTRKNALGTATVAGGVSDSVWNILAGSINTISVTGSVAGLRLRSAGDITSFTAGAVADLVLGAGVSMSQLELNGHVLQGDLPNAPTGKLGTFTVKGLKVPVGQVAPRFVVNSYISACVGTMSLLNWDGNGGLWAPAGKLGSIKNVDTVVPANSWTYSALTRTIAVGAQNFIHVI